MLCWSSTKRSKRALLGMRAAPVRGTKCALTQKEMRGTKVRVVRAVGICSIKSHELPDGHPDRKYKGRFVLQGNEVRDEAKEAALVQELCISPPALRPLRYAMPSDCCQATSWSSRVRNRRACKRPCQMAAWSLGPGSQRSSGHRVDGICGIQCAR